MPITIAQGDITTFQVDAIVNAANPSLLGGGGVDGAIHAAAGPELLKACIPLGGCSAGEARITPGFRLPARYVIHTPGPIWQGGGHGEAQTLASCYRESLLLAEAHGCKTVAFPSISTGVYGYPVELAAPIALTTLRDTLPRCPGIQAVTMVCFSRRDYETYTAALARIQ